MMETNDDLVDYLCKRNYIESEAVKEAFRNIDRADFVPEKYSSNCYDDRPLPIGVEATISAPHMVAKNTELLEVDESSVVLEMGSGSGYQLAILSELAREVIGIEIEEELVNKSSEILDDRPNVKVVQGSSLEAADSKFDRILYSFGTDDIEDAKNKIKSNGIIVAPLNTNGAQKLTKWKEGHLQEHGRVRFVREK